MTDAEKLVVVLHYLRTKARNFESNFNFERDYWTEGNHDDSMIYGEDRETQRVAQEAKALLLEIGEDENN